MPVQVVIVDSSKAFEGVDDPSVKTSLAAPPAKRAPYQANIKLLLESLGATGGVKHFTLTTDSHPTDHRNFIPTLCEDDAFFALYANHIQESLEAKLKELKAKTTTNSGAAADLENAKRIEALEKSHARIVADKTDPQKRASLVEDLDSLLPLGLLPLEYSLPQLLQTKGDDGKVKTVGVIIGSKAYAATCDANQKIKITSLVAFDEAELKDGTKTISKIFAWPAHSADKTMTYPEYIASFFAKEADVDVNAAITGLHSAVTSGRNEKPTSETKIIGNNGYEIVVSNKGQDPSIENYSSLFNEGVGINVDAMVAAVAESFELIKNTDEPLEMVFCGIAYDFCVKNRELDTANFVAPALQALKIMHKNGIKIDENKIREVVGVMEKIVAKRIADGNEHIKDGISTLELLHEFQIAGAKELLHPIQITVPKGATIFIFGEESARKEVRSATAKQKLGFLEADIAEVTANIAATMKPQRERIEQLFDVPQTEDPSKQTRVLPTMTPTTRTDKSRQSLMTKGNAQDSAVSTK
jgi:hypothetical protein